MIYIVCSNCRQRFHISQWHWVDDNHAKCPQCGEIKTISKPK